MSRTPNTKRRRNNSKKILSKNKKIRYRKKRITKRNRGGGGNEDLINTIKKIYSYITIEYDSPDYIGISRIFNYKNKTGGGVTYQIPIDTQLNTDNLKNISFGPNNEPITEIPNFVIVGGGPVGLYMGILLKMLYPLHQIHILEKRHSNDKRTLERGNVLLVGKLTDNVSNDFNNYKKKDESIENFINRFYNDFYKNYDSNVPDVFKVFVQKNNFSFIEFLNETITTIPINILEYKLANYAQYIGVNIIYTEFINLEILPKYVNPQTKMIFDATGGHMRPELFNGVLSSVHDYTTKAPVEYIAYSGYNIVTTHISNYYFSLSDGSNKVGFVVRSSYGDVFYSTVDYPSDKSIELFVNEGGNPNRTKKVTVHLRNKSQKFNINCGNLLPENAIAPFLHTHIVCIGNSYMKTNFLYGNGIYYGFMVAFLIAVEIHNHLPPQ